MIAPNRTAAGPDATRTRILAAAREIFERKGSRGTTTREVAERAGVNEATLFRHFGTKQALLQAMRVESCGVEAFRDVLSALPGDPAADLRLIARHSIERMQGVRAMMCVSLAEDAGCDSAPEFQGPTAIIELLSAYFTRRVAEGVVRGEPDLLARTFLGIWFSYVVGRKLWGAGIDSDRAVDFIVDVFLNGVRA